MIYFIFLSMIFLHIIDDFCLQGVLARLKQKDWWKNQEHYSELYKNDYIISLIMHSFEWSFMIMLPIALKLKFEITLVYVLILGINCIIHCLIDDLKANKYKINLIQDQLAHIVQIIITFSFCNWYYNL